MLAYENALDLKNIIRKKHRKYKQENNGYFVAAACVIHKRNKTHVCNQINTDLVINSK